MSLNHTSQPGGQEEAHSAQQADNDEHPEKDSVNDHGHVLPVLLHLQTQTWVTLALRAQGQPEKLLEHGTRSHSFCISHQSDTHLHTPLWAVTSAEGECNCPATARESAGAEQLLQDRAEGDTTRGGLGIYGAHI